MTIKAHSERAKLFQQVKQVMLCDIVKTVNSLLSTKDWIVLDVNKKRNGKFMFCLGRI